MTDEVLEQEFRETLDLLRDSSLKPEERRAACDALKGMAIARAELAKADTETAKAQIELAQARADKKMDVIHATAEVLKAGAMVAGAIFTYKAACNSQLLTADIWKQSLEADKLGELITTSAGRNILSGRRP